MINLEKIQNIADKILTEKQNRLTNVLSELIPVQRNLKNPQIVSYNPKSNTKDSIEIKTISFRDPVRLRSKKCFISSTSPLETKYIEAKFCSVLNQMAEESRKLGLLGNNIFLGLYNQKSVLNKATVGKILTYKLFVNILMKYQALKNKNKNTMFLVSNDLYAQVMEYLNRREDTFYKYDFKKYPIDFQQAYPQSILMYDRSKVERYLGDVSYIVEWRHNLEAGWEIAFEQQIGDVLLLF